MKKLRYVCENEQVSGKVIEHIPSGYALRKYGFTNTGAYNLINTKELELAEESDVLMQDGLANQVKRLHHYFKDADYISEDAIFTLNVEDEDCFEALRDIVEF